MNFSEFDLHPDLLDGLDALKYVKATPIQEQAIPVILAGRDLIGCAQTGTGKTAAFILPIISKIIDSGEADFTQALVIVPTRELATQIDQIVEAYSYFTGVSSIAIYGGTDGKSFVRERNAIENGVDILIATPGRLIAHINMGYVNLKKLHYLVLDEADRMLDMGFLPDLQKIFAQLNPKRQNLLFSATMPDQVRRIARTILHNPETITIELSKPAAGVTQSAYQVNEDEKYQLIVDILSKRPGQRTIVFASTKKAVSLLYQKLLDKRLPAKKISSDLEQSEREQVMMDFRNKKVEILVATDVLSRGIDVEGIDMVINFDVPHEAEDYVHRIGRTARAERKGEAITLIVPKDLKKFKNIEKLIDRTIDKLPLPAHLTGPSQNNAPGRQSPSAPPKSNGNKNNKNSSRNRWNKKPPQGNPDSKGPRINPDKKD